MSYPITYLPTGTSLSDVILIIYPISEENTWYNLNSTNSNMLMFLWTVSIEVFSTVSYQVKKPITTEDCCLFDTFKESNEGLRLHLNLNALVWLELTQSKKKNN